MPLESIAWRTCVRNSHALAPPPTPVKPLTLILPPHSPNTRGRDMMEVDAIAKFVEECRHPDGGYASSPGLDPHMLYTLSAVQVGTVVILACPRHCLVWCRPRCRNVLSGTG